MDQQKLVEASWVEVVSLYTAYHLSNSQDAKRFKLPNGVNMTEEEVQLSWPEWADVVQSISSTLKPLDIPKEIFGCLAAYSLFYDELEIQNLEMVKATQQKCAQGLKKILNFEEEQTNKFAKVILVIPKLKEAKEKLRQRLI